MDAQLQQTIATREEVLGIIRKLLIHGLHVSREEDEIDPDTPLFGTGLGLDSVDAVELVVSIEDELGVTLENLYTGRRALRTVNTLVDLVLASGYGKN